MSERAVLSGVALDRRVVLVTVLLVLACLFLIKFVINIHTLDWCPREAWEGREKESMWQGIFRLGLGL